MVQLLIPTNAEHTHTLKSSNHTTIDISNRNWYISAPKDMLKSLQNSIHNSQRQETIQMSINSKSDNESWYNHFMENYTAKKMS